MKIRDTVPGWKQEQKENNGDFLSTVLDNVFAIAKTDKNFSSKEKSSQVDNEIKSLNAKVVKQQNLLDQANKIEKETAKKIKNIDEQNFAMKSRLLEILGSELWKLK